MENRGKGREESKTSQGKSTGRDPKNHPEPGPSNPAATGQIISPNPQPQPGGVTGNTHNQHPATTVPGRDLNTQLRDVTGSTQDQGLGPRDRVPQSGWSTGGLPSISGADNYNDPFHMWVINLSSIPLIQAQSSLLPQGPNYAIAPRHPPHLEYISVIESVCQKLNQQDTEDPQQ